MSSVDDLLRQAHEHALSMVADALRRDPNVDSRFTVATARGLEAPEPTFDELLRGDGTEPLPDNVAPIRHRRR